MNSSTAVLLLVLVLSPAAFAQRFESGEQQVQLLELYTSEGCSSCPPADRWLSSLKNEDALWKEIIPVAFHVDYWDYIGWRDRFASREYSQRQRRYAAENSEPTVYTPGVRFNGEEWRSWRNSSSGRPQQSGQVAFAGNLTIDISPEGSFTATFDDQLESSPPLLNIAVLGMGLSSQVKRGENKGRELKHDFVALELARFSTNDSGNWSGKLPVPKIKANRYALAIWVSSGSELRPLQATGGLLAESFSQFD